jgi:hypothetical protein
MKYTPKILELLARTRNPFEIQRLSDAKLSDIRAVMKENASDLPGWGRPSLQRHIISRRKATAPNWPLEDAQTIIDHKRQHDQGRVIMCQGRDQDYILQYAIPTKRPLSVQTYFYGG